MAYQFLFQGIENQAMQIGIVRLSDLKKFDFSDSLFKSSGIIQEFSNVTVFSGRIFSISINTTLFLDGLYSIVIYVNGISRYIHNIFVNGGIVIEEGLSNLIDTSGQALNKKVSFTEYNIDKTLNKAIIKYSTDVDLDFEAPVRTEEQTFNYNEDKTVESMVVKKVG